MKIRKLFTWPGDLGLRFLLWRDDTNFIIYYLLFPIAAAAHSLMITADVIDDIADHYFPKE